MAAAGKAGDRRSGAGTPAWPAAIGIVALGLALGWIVRAREQGDLEAWLVQHRRECHDEAERTAWRVTALVRGVTGRLRALARLPGVRAATDGNALDPDTRSILEDAAHDPAGPRLGLHVLVADRAARGGIRVHAAGAAPADAVRAAGAARLTRWREQFATEADVDPRQPPAAFEHLDAAAAGESGRTAFVSSVPWFRTDGRLGGCVVAVLAADALRALLPRGEYALVHPRLGSVVASASSGPCSDARAQVERGEPDRRLLFSEVQPLDLPGGDGWLLWAGRPDAAFSGRSDVHASRRMAEVGYAATAVLTLALAWVVLAKRRSRRALEAALQDLERRVLERTRELQLASDAKSQILAEVSEEIRAPARELVGSADRLLAGDGTDRDAAVQAIRRSGDDLLAIANEVLDFARIEAGTLGIARARCSPHELVEQVAAAFPPRAAARGVRLLVEHATPLPATIATDAGRVRQILTALLEQALRLTDRGSIQLVTALLQPPDRLPQLEVQVIDSGRGLTDAQLQRLFTPFLDPDESGSRSAGGAGLGLVLAQRLAQLLDGAIHCKSAVGSGTTCTVLLGTGPLHGVPLVTFSRAAAPAAGVARLMARGVRPRVLLVEDGAGEQRELAHALRGLGAELSLADDARVGCELVLEMERQGLAFDVVLMDMELTGLDGYAATARLRAAEYRGAIVALAAAGAGSDRSEAAGCDAHVEKPADARRLAEVLARFTEPSG